MKYPPVYRSLGVVLIILSILGLLFSIFGIATVWLIKPNIQNSISITLESLENIRSNTDESLIIMQDTLDDSIINLSIIASTFENLDETVISITDSLESSATLIGTNLHFIIIDTQVALSSAASSAEIIDDTLAIIALIPFIGTDYQPDVPLHTSLEQVAGSLGEVPETLTTMEDSLMDTAENIGSLNENLKDMARNLSHYEEDLEEAKLVIDEYRVILNQINEQNETIRNQLPRLLTFAAVFTTGLLFWLGTAQIGLLLQGLIYLNSEQIIVNLADISRD